jgi:hypothetical protein
MRVFALCLAFYLIGLAIGYVAALRKWSTIAKREHELRIAEAKDRTNEPR